MRHDGPDGGAQGDEDAPLLASLVDGIKFQLTGETPVQGMPPQGKEDDPDYEVKGNIFQLYAGGWGQGRHGLQAVCGCVG